MQKEKVRVYQLAKKLGVKSKELVEFCQQAGLDVKNQLTTLDSDQQDMVTKLAKGGGSTATATAAPPPPQATPRNVQRKVRTLSTGRTVRTQEPAKTDQQPESRPVESTPVDEPVEQPAAETTPDESPVVSDEPTVVEQSAAADQSPASPDDDAQAPAAEGTSPGDQEAKPPKESPQAKAASLPDMPGAGKMRDLGSRTAGSSPRRKSRDVRPTFRVAPMPTLKPSKEVRKPKEELKQKPIAKITPDLIKENKGVLRPEDLLPKTTPDAEIFDDDDDGTDKGKGKGKGEKGGKLKEVPGRDSRKKARTERAKRRKVRPAGEDEEDALSRLKQRGAKGTKQRLRERQRTQPRKGKVPIEMPITVRSLSEAVGVPAVKILFRLRDEEINNATINTTLDAEMAELIAMEAGCELEIKRPPDAEELFLADFSREDADEDLQPRAPVVTVMGHVDHGKTSLLDKIRRTNVVDTEAGGITQVIRAWRVEHGDHPITFLDTPGHEAFTKMRARGAQVTDIAVIVVAADDGVMPQTEEAINHAKAAGVSLVVAINKIDVPNADLNKTKQMLYGMEVLPDNMGGDTPFVETSAATGQGIDELLEQISIVAELKELKANPSRPGRGTCLEANLSEGEGVQATLLVQNGTMRKGDVIVCGPAFGRVRQMYNDLGKLIQEAGPSVPVRITGLDVVPSADDPFHVVPDLNVAREIAEQRRQRIIIGDQIERAPMTLESLTQSKIEELKVILKADFRGSIEAIRKELEKLDHAEVRVRVLESAIGAVTENDVWLALTSPRDTIIVGFNVIADDRARALADSKGVDIRLYNVIYNLTNEIRSALEGKLKPHQKEVQLGRAVVRDTFKISRVGTIAGCYVTSGNIKRNAKVKLIRDGKVIYPPAERSVGLASLKRYKDDTNEVREGFDCGIKIAGYDDVKTGDVIEAYRVEQIQRTLDD